MSATSSSVTPTGTTTITFDQIPFRILPAQALSFAEGDTFMVSRKMEHAALVTREAHLALLDLKRLVDRAAQKTHAAELETVGQAVASSHGEHVLIALRTVAETIGSADFDTALSQARMKIDAAVAWHLRLDEP